MNEDSPRRKLRIAMVCDSVTHYTAGVFVSTLRFSQALTDRGHTIIFITTKSRRYPDNTHYNGFRTYRFNSIYLPKSEKSMYISFPSTRQIKKILEGEKIDIVHTLLPTPSAVVATRAAKALGIKIVAHSHAQAENMLLAFPIAFLRAPLGNVYERYFLRLYRKAHFIIHPSQFAAELMQERTTTLDSAVISNGVDSEQFMPLEKSEVESFLKRFSDVPRDTVKILFVGRLHPEKSVDTLIRAMATIVRNRPDVHLMIVGIGDWEPQLRKLVARLELEKNMTFLGKISNEDLVRAYNAADLFVLPSLAELEGMVVLEAMACGLPILIADSPASASRFFVDGNGLLFEPQNPEHLAQQALKILGDAALRIKMGEISLKKSKKYDLNNSVISLEGHYYRLLKL